jgi:hypothetical protein
VSESKSQSVELAMETKTLDYEVDKYPFPEVIRSWLGVERLEDIHEGVDYEVFTRETDQSTEFHRRLYEIGDDFYDVYRRFLVDVARPFFGEDLIYQRIPSFRIHLPGNVAVGEFHRDRDYSHGEGEINFWLPVSRAWDTNSVWIETSEGASDFQPYDVEVGQVLVFDGVNLAHGNKLNETGKTRVSFDFRVIPKSQYRPRHEAQSVNTGVRFEIGGYFEELQPG